MKFAARGAAQRRGNFFASGGFMAAQSTSRSSRQRREQGVREMLCGKNSGPSSCASRLSIETSRRAIFFEGIFMGRPGIGATIPSPRKRKAARRYPPDGPSRWLNRRRLFRQRPDAQASHRTRFPLPLRTGSQSVSTHRRAVIRPRRQGGSVAPASSPVASQDWPRNPPR